MKIIRMNVLGMENALARMKIKQIELIQLIADFKSIQNEINDSWSGEAKNAFDAEYEDWVRHLEFLNEKIDEIQKDIKEGLADLQRADSDAKGLFGDSSTDAPPPKGK